MATDDDHEFSVQNPDTDWFLRVYVRMAEETGEQWITLTIGGSIVIGQIVSPLQYFEGIFGQSVHDAKHEQGGLSVLAELFLDPQQHEEFVHLKNVDHAAPGVPTSPSNGYWRGRLDQVSGFGTGQLKILTD